MSNNNEHKRGYKHSPLGWIPEEWHVKAIKDVSLDMIQGVNTAIDIPDYVPLGIPILKANNIIDGNVDFESADQISIKTYENYSNRFKAKINDFLFSNIGARLGTGSLMKSNTVCSFAWNVMRIIPDTDIIFPQYLGFIINSPFLSQKIRRAQSGSGMGFVPKNILKNITFYLPQCLFEQRKIAAILATWDEAITKSQQLIAQLQQRNKGLMQELLIGEKRLKGFEKAWQEMHLRDVLTERNETGFINLNLLSVGSLGIYPQSQSEKRDISNMDKSKYKRICPGDIGYNTMRMWQGRSALSSLEGIISPAYTVVTPKKEQHSLFYAYLFKLPSVVNKFFRNSQGLVEDTLNCKFKDLAIVKVEVPEYDEQVAIADVISKSFEQVKVYEQKLAALLEQKKGLMQKLLTGELRVLN